MKKIDVVLVVLLTISSIAFADDPCTPVTHQQLQAVDQDGVGTYNAEGKVIIEGIILNNPADMVDPTANYQAEPVDMGGQWQIFVQGRGDDHAGTAVYMGQNYELLPWIYPPDGSYTDPNWIKEMKRLNASQFGPGDKVRVTGYYMFYKGKTNINERHESSDANNFTIELLENGAGLPRPEVITLDDVKDVNDDFIFDPDRTIGCEYYQGRLVRINDVSFVGDANNWAPDAELQITDGAKTFTVKLGLGTGIYAGSNNLTAPFDVIGIFDQEAAGWPADCTTGYRIWVMDYDGNGSVLSGREHRRAAKPGDADLDGVVDFYDFAELAADWLD
ncbi:MAG: hypothetical protein WC476_04845 [Phycisphaerae bacterium]